MRRASKVLGRVLTYGFLTALLVVMIYPLLWILASSFRTNEEIFQSISLIPKQIVTDSYLLGWKGTGNYTYTTYFLNSFKLVLPTVLGTVLSSTLVAYAFARFQFRFKRFLFMLVISSLLLPNEVLVVPRYLLFNKLGWVDSYLPFIVPAFFCHVSIFHFYASTVLSLPANGNGRCSRNRRLQFIRHPCANHPAAVDRRAALRNGVSICVALERFS